MDETFLRQCLLLHGIPELSDAHLRLLLMHYGGPPEVCSSPTTDWPALGIPRAVCAAADKAFQLGAHPDAAQPMSWQLGCLVESAVTVLPLSSAAYPALLRSIHDPPPFLYVRGNPDLLGQAQLAVVGARRASPAGLRAAQELAAAVASAGLLITSGLAIGIDGAAHRGALQAGCPTVAVMATGIERIYPARHRALAAEVEAAGCLVSEFAPGTPPLREHFPRRNRVVTGLSLGTLVVEAALPSGSLISAQSALEQNREVFALPWSVYHAGGAGCLKLLREGAHLVLEVADLLDELGPAGQAQGELFAPAEALPALSDEQARLLQLVGYEIVQARDLVNLAALPVARIMAGLSALELKGLVVRCEGGYVRP